MPKQYVAHLAGPWSDYYKLDTITAHKLQYITLKSAGIKIIAEKYRAQYGFTIAVDDYVGFGFARQNFLAKLRLQLDSLQEGEIRGIVLNSTYQDGNLVHSTPYIATKSDGKITVVDFEKRFPLQELGCTIKQAKKEYQGLQADSVSCGVFAINTIKNCLKDREFLAQLVNEEATAKAGSAAARKESRSSDDSDTSTDEEEEVESELEIVNLKKTIGQRTKVIKTLSQEQKDKYVHALKNMYDLGQLKDFNLKAFYKGHDYARIINPDHLSLLDKDSRNMVLKIDEIRREIKAKKPSSAKPTQEEMQDLGDTISGVGSKATQLSGAQVKIVERK